MRFGSVEKASVHGGGGGGKIHGGGDGGTSVHGGVGGWRNVRDKEHKRLEELEGQRNT